MATRIISAALGAVLVLTMLAVPEPAPLILILVIWIAAMHELGVLLGEPRRRIVIVLLLHAALLYLANVLFAFQGLYHLGDLRDLLIVLISTVAVAQLLLGDLALRAFHAGRTRCVNFVWHSFIFITVPLYFLWVKTSFGPLLVVTVLGLAWSADTGSMIAGKLFGQRHITPRVSPGKTLEGVIGGWAAMAVFILLTKCAVAAHYGHDICGIALGKLNPTLVMVIVVALSAAWLTLMGLIGDVTFSAIKRTAGVKDFGKTMPGHGGILDRIDALLFMIPWYFLCIALFTGRLFL
jgi:phosphatidate cytidylyltransferase